MIATKIPGRRFKIQRPKNNKLKTRTELTNSKKKGGVPNFLEFWGIVADATGPYVVKRVLEKGAYELVDYEGTALVEPRNGLYLKKYYA